MPSWLPQLLPLPGARSLVPRSCIPDPAPIGLAVLAFRVEQAPVLEDTLIQAVKIVVVCDTLHSDVFFLAFGEGTPQVVDPNIRCRRIVHTIPSNAVRAVPHVWRRGLAV